MTPAPFHLAKQEIQVNRAASQANLDFGMKSIPQTHSFSARSAFLTLSFPFPIFSAATLLQCSDIIPIPRFGSQLAATSKASPHLTLLAYLLPTPIRSRGIGNLKLTRILTGVRIWVTSNYLNMQGRLVIETDVVKHNQILNSRQLEF